MLAQLGTSRLRCLAPKMAFLPFLQHVERARACLPACLLGLHLTPFYASLPVLSPMSSVPLTPSFPPLCTSGGGESLTLPLLSSPVPPSPSHPAAALRPGQSRCCSSTTPRSSGCLTSWTHTQLQQQAKRQYKQAVHAGSTYRQY